MRLSSSRRSPRAREDQWSLYGPGPSSPRLIQAKLIFPARAMERLARDGQLCQPYTSPSGLWRGARCGKVWLEELWNSAIPGRLSDACPGTCSEGYIGTVPSPICSITGRVSGLDTASIALAWLYHGLTDAVPWCQGTPTSPPTTSGYDASPSSPSCQTTVGSSTGLTFESSPLRVRLATLPVSQGRRFSHCRAASRSAGRATAPTHQRSAAPRLCQVQGGSSNGTCPPQHTSRRPSAQRQRRWGLAADALRPGRERTSPAILERESERMDRTGGPWRPFFHIRNHLALR